MSSGPFLPTSFRVHYSLIARLLGAILSELLALLLNKRAPLSSPQRHAAVLQDEL
jgi:hypothetical protein